MLAPFLQQDSGTLILVLGFVGAGGSEQQQAFHKLLQECEQREARLVQGKGSPKQSKPPELLLYIQHKTALGQPFTREALKAGGFPVDEIGIPLIIFSHVILSAPILQQLTGLTGHIGHESALPSLLHVQWLHITIAFLCLFCLPLPDQSAQIDRWLVGQAWLGCHAINVGSARSLLQKVGTVAIYGCLSEGWTICRIDQLLLNIHAFDCFF